MKSQPKSDVLYFTTIYMINIWDSGAVDFEVVHNDAQTASTKSYLTFNIKEKTVFNLCLTNLKTVHNCKCLLFEGQGGVSVII